jgi:hypothetical protein
VIHALVIDLLTTARTSALRDKEISLLALATRCDAADIKYSLDLIKDLSPISNYTPEPFLKILSSPICTYLVTEWITIQFQTTTSFDRYYLSTVLIQDRYIENSENPVLLDILVEIAIAQPLQMECIFKVLVGVVERDFGGVVDAMEDVSPLQVEQWKRVFCDFMVVLVKLGFTWPVLDFISNVPEEYLKVHFVKAILTVVEAPYENRFIVKVLGMLEGITLENFDELQSLDEDAKTGYVT